MRAEQGALARFQDAFTHALAGADPGAGGAVAKLLAEPGFKVYRNTVLKGCVDALQANFPAVTRLVGEAWLRATAAVFVSEYPPRVPVLLEYGAEFPAFLEKLPSAGDLPYLAGVAKLDRWWTEAHCAPDDQPLTPHSLTQIAVESLARTRLVPHASARWAWFEDQPIATIWRRNRYEAEPPDFSALEWRAEGILIVRPQGEVHAHALDRAAFQFLDACGAGAGIVQAADGVLAQQPGTDMSRLIAHLVEAGAFGPISIESPEE